MKEKHSPGYSQVFCCGKPQTATSKAIVVIGTIVVFLHQLDNSFNPLHHWTVQKKGNMSTSPKSKVIYGKVILMVLMFLSIHALHTSTRWGAVRYSSHGFHRQYTSFDAKLSDTEPNRPTDEYMSNTFFNNRRNNYDYRSEQSAKGWLAVLRSFREVHSTSPSSFSTSTTSTTSTSTTSMLLHDDEEDGTYLDAHLVDDVDVVVKVVADIPIAEVPETLISPSTSSYRSRTERSSNTHTNERRKMSEGKVGYGTIRREVSVAFRDLRYLIETSQQRQQLQPRGSSSGSISSTSSGASPSSSVATATRTTVSFNPATVPTTQDSHTKEVTSAPDDTTALGFLRNKALSHDNYTHLEINFLATKMMTLCGDVRNGGNWKVCGEVLTLLRETQRGPDSFALTGKSTHPINTP